MPISLGKSAAALMIVVATLFGGGEGHAITLQQRQQDELLHKRLGIPLPIIEQQRRRQDFQVQQRRFREQDRRRLQDAKPNLAVPSMRPNCQLQIQGNEYLRRNCR